MHRFAGLFALILAVTACGGSSEDTTTSDSPTSTTSIETTTTVAPADSTTTPEPETTTTSGGEEAGARFVITSVSLGDLGQVVVQNVGDSVGSLAGHFLCQRPAYWEFPDVELQPGEAAAVSVGGDIFAAPPGAIAIEGVATVGPFDPSSGEIGLYVGNSFGDSGAIVSYVEWGESGHGRSGTAVSAGIWPDGGFVETSDATGAILATQIPATDPSHWITG